MSNLATFSIRLFTAIETGSRKVNTASLPNFALDAHAPAVRRGDVFDQTQSQPVAVNLRR